MIKLHNFIFPSDCVVIRNEFYDYDPSEEFNAENCQKYLSEDLFQCAFPSDDLIIDLGWYGDVESGRGEFKILVIKNENWEIPANEIYLKSVEEVKQVIQKVLFHCTATESNAK